MTKYIKGINNKSGSMVIPLPAGAAANNAKLVVTLILYTPWSAKTDAQGTGTSAKAEACTTNLSPGIVLAS
jgi:hypothetical protein